MCRLGPSRKPRRNDGRRLRRLPRHVQLLRAIPITQPIADRHLLGPRGSRLGPVRVERSRQGRHLRGKRHLPDRAVPHRPHRPARPAPQRPPPPRRGRQAPREGFHGGEVELALGLDGHRRPARSLADAHDPAVDAEPAVADGQVAGDLPQGGGVGVEVGCQADGGARARRLGQPIADGDGRGGRDRQPCAGARPALPIEEQPALHGPGQADVLQRGRQARPKLRHLGQVVDLPLAVPLEPARAPEDRADQVDRGGPFDRRHPPPDVLDRSPPGEDVPAQLQVALRRDELPVPLVQRPGQLKVEPPPARLEGDLPAEDPRLVRPGVQRHLRPRPVVQDLQGQPDRALHLHLRGQVGLARQQGRQAGRMDRPRQVDRLQGLPLAGAAGRGERGLARQLHPRQKHLQRPQLHPAPAGRHRVEHRRRVQGRLGHDRQRQPRVRLDVQVADRQRDLQPVHDPVAVHLDVQRPAAPPAEPPQVQPQQARQIQCRQVDVGEVQRHRRGDPPAAGAGRQARRRRPGRAGLLEERRHRHPAQAVQPPGDELEVGDVELEPRIRRRPARQPPDHGGPPDADPSALHAVHQRIEGRQVHPAVVVHVDVEAQPVQLEPLEAPVEQVVGRVELRADPLHHEHRPAAEPRRAVHPEPHQFHPCAAADRQVLDVDLQPRAPRHVLGDPAAQHRRRHPPRQRHVRRGRRQDRPHQPAADPLPPAALRPCRPLCPGLSHASTRRRRPRAAVRH